MDLGRVRCAAKSGKENILNIKISITKAGRISAGWRDCFATMSDIHAVGNELRVRQGLQPMNIVTLYRLRTSVADAWLDARIRRFRNQPSMWRRNPFLAYRKVGNAYLFKPRNANQLLTVMVGYKLGKPRGLPSLMRKRRKLVAV